MNSFIVAGNTIYESAGGGYHVVNFVQIHKSDQFEVSPTTVFINKDDPNPYSL